MTGLEAAYRTVGSKGMPITVVWGDRDKTVSYELLRTTMEYVLPSATFAIIPNAGHSDMFAVSKHFATLTAALTTHFSP